ncbi:mitochondrial 54S ribosomal protein mL54 MRPL37 PWA37_003410 [Arxiozyma heterogenica]|uniref:Large ribosomal subunit protein mL54 n=1 Tax=Arxiozyma heterogenica TaxID=278026 RepID=A0AAN7WRL8_9SACH|nr:hypothetical protein RI543_001879 [Kazachstania heterogenica]
MLRVHCNSRRLLTTSTRLLNVKLTETVNTSTTSNTINEIKGKSSCPMGTKLNLDIWKDPKRDPVAKADNEYPDWLWNIIPSDHSKGTKSQDDPFVKRAKELRKLHRNQIKQNNYLSKLK